MMAAAAASHSRDAIYKWQQECIQRLQTVPNTTDQAASNALQSSWDCIHTVAHLMCLGAFHEDHAIHRAHLMLLCAYGTRDSAAAVAAEPLLRQRLVRPPTHTFTPTMDALEASPSSSSLDTALMQQQHTAAPVALLQRAGIECHVRYAVEQQRMQPPRRVKNLRAAAASLWHWLRTQPHTASRFLSVQSSDHMHRNIQSNAEEEEEEEDDVEALLTLAKGH